MVNDLVIVEKIEKRLRAKRPASDNVFPLTPTHRKELRQLRDGNISGLRSRLSDIRSIKQDEFFNKYRKKAEKQIVNVDSQVKVLNNSYESLSNEIKLRINGIKKLETECDMIYISINHDYNDISSLYDFKSKRTYSKNKRAVETQLKKMFNEKFQDKFKQVQDKIDKMLEQYEEAINFGDLEIVKELYYSLKDADRFLDKVSKIKV